MKNSLSDLNNYLFESLERINDDSLSDDQLSKEIKKAKTTAEIGMAIIKNAETIIQAKKVALEYSLEKDILSIEEK